MSSSPLPKEKIHQHSPTRKEKMPKFKVKFVNELSQPKLPEAEAEQGDKFFKKNTNNLYNKEQTMDITEFKNNSKLRAIKYIKNVEKMIEDTFEESKFRPNFLIDQGIIQYDPEQFVVLTKLGEGSFGKVVKAFRKRDRELVAIKFVKTQPSLPKFPLLKVQESVASLLVEKKILERLMEIQMDVKYFTSYQGTFFANDRQGKVENLILITTAGNCDLERLVKARRRANYGEPAYSPEEALKIMRHLIRGLRYLQENRIYHSDIKLANVVVNLEMECYMFLDFGVSKLIPEGADVVFREDYATAGTKGFLSPEKKQHWDKAMEALIKEEDPKEEDSKVEGENQEKKEEEDIRFFNPFKCDIWSLGVCFSEMVGGIEKTSGQAKIILEKMMETNWEARMDAIELDKFFKNNMNLESPLNLSSSEKEIIKEITDKVNEEEDFRDLFWKLQKATMIHEQIEFLENMLNKHLSKEEEEMTAQELLDVAWLRHELGWALRQKGDLQGTLVNMEKALLIKKKVYSNGENEDIAASLSVLGSTKNLIGQYHEALKMLTELLEMQKRIYGTNQHRQVAITLQNLATTWGNLGDHQKALDQNKEVLAIQMNLFKTEDHPDVAITLYNIALDNYNLKNYKTALEGWQNVLQIRLKLFRTEEHPDVAMTLNNIASVWGKLGEKKRAAFEHKRVLDIRLKIYKTDEHPDVAFSLNNLGLKLSDLGEYDEAIKHITHALKIRRKIYGNELHPLVSTTKANLEAVKKKIKEQKPKK